MLQHLLQPLQQQEQKQLQMEQHAVGGVSLAEKSLTLVIANMRVYIAETYAAAMGQNTLNGSMVAGTGAATTLNVALLRLKTTFLVMFGFLKKFAKQLAILE
jgi:hypothetical protein